MIEGQEGVTWEQWVALARTCEAAGLEGLFRSDHYSSIHGGTGGSLDAWATVIALSALTDRIQLGTMVSPATFRHPSVLARLVVTANHVSGGRTELGFGAGWNEAEHLEHGFPFPTTKERLALLAEQLEIIQLSWGDERFDFVGRHYELRGSFPLPKPLGKVNVIVGGSAKAGTVEPAVRFADEYNTGLASPHEARQRRLAVDAACARAGRPPLIFSLTLQCAVGEDRDAVARRVDRIASITGSDPSALPASDRADAGVAINGTVDEVVERLREYEAAGVERVMLQHFLPDDLEMVELLGREVIPQLR
jgi:alkanesulfonate monooxygenase SsuD/methylene tetrahydromethanopterin reductase-like flavin-dependent oxidoreductase (luciferase family)